MALNHSTSLSPVFSTENSVSTTPPALDETCLMRSPYGDVEEVPIFAQFTILNLVRRGWTFVEEVES